MGRFVAVVVLAAFVGAACGSGSDDLNPAEARRIVGRAQLTAADLGPDWTKTADERPDDGGEDDDLEVCLGADLDMADDTLAESRTRTFERATSDVAQQQVVVSSAVLRHQRQVDDLFRLVATDRFARCVSDAFRVQLLASGEVASMVPGPATVDRGQIAGADHSAHIVAPFSLQAAPLDTSGQVDLVILTSGPVVSLVFGFAIGEPIARGTLGQIGDILLRRQQP